MTFMLMSGYNKNKSVCNCTELRGKQKNKQTWQKLKYKHKNKKTAEIILTLVKIFFLCKDLEIFIRLFFVKK